MWHMTMNNTRLAFKRGHTAASCLCLPVLLLNAWVATSAFAVTDTSKIQAPVAANVVSIDDLANAQRQKLRGDLGKSESTKERGPERATTSVAKRETRMVPSPQPVGTTTQTLVLMATYGTKSSPRAEVQFNGMTRVVSPKAVLGATTVEEIHHGRIKVTVSQKQKAISYTLQPGERLDFEP